MHPINQPEPVKDGVQSARKAVNVLNRIHAQDYSAPELNAGEIGTFLETKELAALTGRIRRSAQVKALRSMGIEHRVRPDGSPAVLRAHINHIFEATHKSIGSPKKQASPNWAAI